MNRLLKQLKSRLALWGAYPELAVNGGITKAMNSQFVKLHSALRVANDGNYKKPYFGYAMVENGNKYVEVDITAKEKLYTPVFWKDGVCMAKGGTDSLSKTAPAIVYWLNNDISAQALSDEFDFVKPHDQAEAFDEGKEVEYSWQRLMADSDWAELKQFIELAVNDEVLSKLFPFTSLYTLCFSKCTGYPFDTVDLPNITATQYANFALPPDAPCRSEIKRDASVGNDIIYVLTKNHREFIGQGTAAEALSMIRAILPDDIQPARKGTADDLII